MATGNNNTTYSDLLKVWYQEDRVANLMFDGNPFLASMELLQDQTGLNFTMPVVYAAGQSFSPSFATALAQSTITATALAQFAVTRVVQSSIATVSAQTIDDSSTDKGAFLRAIPLITDTVLKDFTNRLAIQAYGPADGNLGQISSTTTIASSTMTLSNPANIVYFNVGMALDLATSTAGSTILAYGSNSTPLYVNAIDMSAGTLSFGQSPTPGSTPVNINDSVYGCPSAAQGNYIYQSGCKNAVMTGFQGWCPNSSPATNDSFFGQNRSYDATRLAGSYINGQGGTTGEVLQKASAQLANISADMDTYFMAFSRWNQLALEIGAKQEFVDVKINDNITLSFNAIKIHGFKRPITCIPDRSCPSTLIAGCKMGDWQLNSVKKAPRLWDDDGNVWLRLPSDAGAQVRFWSNSQFACKEPRNNVNITVSP